MERGGLKVKKFKTNASEQWAPRIGAATMALSTTGRLAVVTGDKICLANISVAVRVS